VDRSVKHGFGSEILEEQRHALAGVGIRGIGDGLILRGLILGGLILRGWLTSGQADEHCGKQQNANDIAMAHNLVGKHKKAAPPGGIPGKASAQTQLRLTLTRLKYKGNKKKQKEDIRKQW
jgi:hypothetical protein